ncbi:MAG: DNA methyltransferase, partial [Actinomycetota bacterium]
MTFESEEARRAYFLDRLREKLKDPEFRRIEGFPKGSDEDILALSDPPYYTACPNPFIEDFIEWWRRGSQRDGQEDYHREPFAADVSEGKNDPIYNAHSYHTKVPHRAVMRYILHYTEPGDIVFDGFAGTGMTGVAAQLCGDRKTVESLGYRVLEDGTILDEEGRPFSKLGARRAILNDLSPAATFIAYNYNTPVDVEEFEREAERILQEVEEECGWMYLTLHETAEEQIAQAKEALEEDPQGLAGRLDLPFGRINYTVWSDVFVCPECSGEVVFWEAAVDKEAGKVRDEFPCPHCGANLTKKRMERARETRFDEAINQTVRQARQVPVLINYSVGRKRYEKEPDAFDLALVEKIEESPIPYWFPTDRMPEGEESRRNDDIGLTHVHHFYTKRNLWLLSALTAQCRTREHLGVVLDGFPVTTKMSRFRVPAWISKTTGPMKGWTAGTLYAPSIPGEQSWINVFKEKSQMVARSLRKYDALAQPAFANTQTAGASNLSVPSGRVDYIFTDPPFGGNLMYSELNFLWEAWLKVFTNNEPEAVVNKVQRKGLLEYQELMTRCFEEYCRVLKPGRWMTVEFHNSKNSVWVAIQEALQHAGFVVADVRILDKKQGTFKQVTSGGAVKQDLVISAYKPNGGLEKRFELEAGTEEGVWDFVSTHLRQLPVFVPKGEGVEVVAERMNYLLYDRMVAFHVQRGVAVPLSAAEFYAGLKQRYPERDGMYFLPDQVAEYDKNRLKVKEALEPQLFITEEESARQWLRQSLSRKPKTFQELHPEFMRAVGGWQKHEKPLELSKLLEES